MPGHYPGSTQAAMLRAGEWAGRKRQVLRGRKTSFRLNAIYSPWLRFGDIAYEFLTSKSEPELLQNFINSWLAEPWEQTTVRMNSSELTKRSSGYDDGIVPPGALLLTAAWMCRKTVLLHYPRLGRAHDVLECPHGFCETWDEIEEVMNLPYYTPTE
ncbi:phage terminase large subunit family protein [Paenibacillus melissococcoides]|uniref:phage terminase large subunit family protein n=1 Tax=Paenibacillus melissococcoides TaxID=2912268 RepID=UPI0021C3C876|nr:phage terminase large subunit family protein [Paenibacillus melissococcoides]